MNESDRNSLDGGEGMGPLPPSEYLPQPFAEQHVFRDRLLAMVGALGVTGLVVVIGTTMWSTSTPTAIELPAAVAEAHIEPPVPTTPNPYTVLTLEADAVMVYDLALDAPLFAKNADAPKPLASLTKLMTGLLASEALEHEKHIVIRPSALEAEGDSGLYANETWSWRDLLSFMMMTSSNDGADALATVAGLRWMITEDTTPPARDYEKVDAFVKQMNIRARSIGLSNTFYRNATGLDEGPAREGATGTAADSAKLVAYIWEHHPEVLEHTTEDRVVFRSIDGRAHPAENTNEYVRKVPGLLGSKTGFTDLAGGNLAIVYDSGLNHPIVIVVLGSSRQGRFVDVDKLVQATAEYMVSDWFAYEQAGSTPRL